MRLWQMYFCSLRICAVRKRLFPWCPEASYNWFLIFPGQEKEPCHKLCYQQCFKNCWFWVTVSDFLVTLWHYRKNNSQAGTPLSSVFLQENETCPASLEKCRQWIPRYILAGRNLLLKIWIFHNFCFHKTSFKTEHFYPLILCCYERKAGRPGWKEGIAPSKVSKEHFSVGLITPHRREVKPSEKTQSQLPSPRNRNDSASPGITSSSQT